MGQTLTRVAKVLATFDVEHRSVWVLFELEGESCADIARALGIPVGTVYSRLHHARRAFQRAFDDPAPEPEAGAHGGVHREAT